MVAPSDELDATRLKETPTHIQVDHLDVRRPIVEEEHRLQPGFDVSLRAECDGEDRGGTDLELGTEKLGAFAVARCVGSPSAAPIEASARRTHRSQ